MRPTPRRLLAFVDGTWCGAETNTCTNIQMMARMIGVPILPKGKSELHCKERNLSAKYFDGIGLNSTFLAYLFNGSTASDISEACIEVYQWLAEHFKEGTEIWMFGLSRGAYTVRCVAGMINNCGIIKDAKYKKNLSKEVYNIYSSPYDQDKPNSPQSEIFRTNASFPDKKPVKLLGLLDTVGSIGIPNINSGNGPSYPTLWDQVVPDVVDTVFHACSVHDRLSVFQPCLARLPDKEKTIAPPKITQKWFPGCHYDLGRQRFKFLRQKPKSWIERTLSWLPNLLSETLEPNEVLSDLVLRWMLKSIKDMLDEENYVQDSSSAVFKNLDGEIIRLDQHILLAKNVGSGDVYANSVGYAPFGSILRWLPQSSLVTAATEKLIIRDRRIPDEDALIYNIDEPFTSGSLSIKTLGKVEGRYPSQTLPMWEIWKESIKQKSIANGNAKELANGYKNGNKNGNKNGD